MKDVFDYLEEEDLLRNLPEALPQMEDETAAKRIEKMALEKLQAEAKQQKKWQKRRILIAAVCGRGVCTQADCGIFPAYPALSARCRGLYQ